MGAAVAAVEESPGLLPHGKGPWGHTDAGGDEGARVSSISSLRPCVHGQQQAHFPHEVLGYNCEDPYLERGQVPRLGTSLACGRILPLRVSQ